MGSRALDVNVISAKDLKDVNLMSRMDVYVIVSISGDSKKQKTKTPVHLDGGSDPTWNFPVRFTVDDSLAHQNRLSLVFKLKSQRALGDKPIGDVIVPINDLLNSREETNSLRSVSYQVITPSGKPEGKLYFSYKFSDVVPADAASVGGYSAVKGYEPVKAYPVSGSTSTAPEPAMAYPPPPTAGYAYPMPGENMGYPYPPPQQYGGYPPPPQNGGYPPQGYGYPPPPQAGYGAYPVQGGYGYPPMMMQQQKPPKKKKSGMGMGLLGGMLGGLLIGDMVSDAAACSAAEMDMGGDFDF